jgi:hypothetical protein
MKWEMNAKFLWKFLKEDKLELPKHRWEDNIKMEEGDINVWTKFILLRDGVKWLFFERQ